MANTGIVGEVRFDDPTHAMMALQQLNGTVIGGSMIDLSMHAMNNPGKTKLLVKNIPKNFSWMDLKDHFRRIGTVGYAGIYGQGKGGGPGGKGGGPPDGGAALAAAQMAAAQTAEIMAMRNHSEGLDQGFLLDQGGFGGVKRAFDGAGVDLEAEQLAKAAKAAQEEFENQMKIEAENQAIAAQFADPPSISVPVQSQPVNQAKCKATVRYSSPMEASTAVGLFNGFDLGGGAILTATIDPTSVAGTKVLIRNLPASTEWQDVKNFCGQVGNMLFCDVEKEESTIAPLSLPPLPDLIGTTMVDAGGQQPLGAIPPGISAPAAGMDVMIPGMLALPGIVPQPGMMGTGMMDAGGQQLPGAIPLGITSPAAGMDAMNQGQELLQSMGVREYEDIINSQLQVDDGRRRHGFSDSPLGGSLGDAPQPGLGEPQQGLGDAALQARGVYSDGMPLQARGFSDAQARGFSDAQARGFSDAQARGFSDAQARGFSDAQARGFSDAQARGFSDGPGTVPAMMPVIPSHAPAMPPLVNPGAGTLVGEVRYDFPEHAQKALNELNGSTLAGGVIGVHMHKMNNPLGTKLLITGIPATCHWSVMKNFFATCGQVAFADINDGSKGSKGMGKGKSKGKRDRDL